MKKKRKTIAGIVVSLIFLGLIFYKIDVSQLVATFKQFDFMYLPAIVALFLFSLLCRTYRWMYLLKADPKFSLYKLGSTWVVGNLMNAFLPARAGDIWRSYEIGSSVKDSKMRIFGSVMLERIMDGVSICVMLYACIMMYANLSWIRSFADISMLLFGGSLITCFLIVRFNKISSICDFLIKIASKSPLKVRDGLVNFSSKICHHMTSFINGFEVLKSNYYAAQSMIMSFATWFLECLLTYYVITAFGIPCPFSASLFVICFVALSSMIPSSSIFIGPYQYAYILALGIYFIPKSQALAVAFGQQTIIMLSLVVFSAIFCAINFALDLKNKSRSIESEEKVLQEA